MRCPKCGHEISADAKFCNNCGASIAQTKETPSSQSAPQYYVSSKSRMIAMLLACAGFFGFAGFHRFYVGKKWTGFLYLFTMGIFFLGTLWDLYQLYDESFRDGDGYPLFSDDSMKVNYHRRTPKASSGIVVYLFAACFSLLMIGFTSFSITKNATDATDPQQVAQKQETKSDKSSSGTSDKDKKKNRHSPVIDIPMTGTPVENIKKTVAENFEQDSTETVKFDSVDIDTTNGTAKVTIYLHGAKGLTASGTLASFNLAAKQEFAALYQVQPGIPIENVRVVVHMRTVSRSTGEENNIKAYIIGMSRAAASKMHWENYDQIDIMSAVDELKFHGAFKQLLDQNAGKSTMSEAMETLGF